MTVLSKKRRLKRAHAHQAFCKGREQFYRALELAGGQPLAPYQRRLVKTVLAEQTDSLKNFTPTHADTDFGTIELETPPSRAKCLSCGFSQKVRKDGTFGKHDAIVVRGSLTMKNECLGVGKQWNSG